MQQIFKKKNKLLHATGMQSKSRQQPLIARGGNNNLWRIRQNIGEEINFSDFVKGWTRGVIKFYMSHNKKVLVSKRFLRKLVRITFSCIRF